MRTRSQDKNRPSPKRNSPTGLNTRVAEFEDLAAAQENDDDLRFIIHKLKDSLQQPPVAEVLTQSEVTKRIWSQWHALGLRDGVLHRSFYDRQRNSTYYQAIVPYALREAAVRSCHVGMAGGHLGVKKTLDQVQRRFYWTTWKSDTLRHCRRCPECCSYHRGQLPRTAPLQPIIAGAPFERLSIDLTGPHARSKRGHVYILTCIDPFTKWVEAFPLRNKEAETVAKVLVEQIFCRFGVPIALLSDQGREVDGNLMREICRLLDVDKLRTSPYKASTNSAIERFHRSLNSMLGKVVSESQTDWDDRLPYVMAAYRASRHESTGYTPNALVLGRETRAPIDLVLDLPTADTPTVSYDAYVEDLQDKFRSAYTLVRKELGVTAERNKHYYDLRVRPKQYAVGDWVYYFNPRHYRGRQDKWHRKYFGPMLITAVPSPVNVTIQRNKRAKPLTVHIDKVKPYLGDTPLPWIPIPMEDSTPTTASSEVTSQQAEQPTLPDQSVETSTEELYNNLMEGMRDIVAELSYEELYREIAAEMTGEAIDEIIVEHVAGLSDDADTTILYDPPSDTLSSDASRSSTPARSNPVDSRSSTPPQSDFPDRSPLKSILKPSKHAPLVHSRYQWPSSPPTSRGKLESYLKCKVPHTRLTPITETEEAESSDESDCYVDASDDLTGEYSVPTNDDVTVTTPARTDSDIDDGPPPRPLSPTIIILPPPSKEPDPVADTPVRPPRPQREHRKPARYRD